MGRRSEQPSGATVEGEGGKDKENQGEKGERDTEGERGRKERRESQRNREAGESEREAERDKRKREGEGGEKEREERREEREGGRKKEPDGRERDRRGERRQGEGGENGRKRGEKREEETGRRKGEGKSHRRERGEESGEEEKKKGKESEGEERERKEKEERRREGGKKRKRQTQREREEGETKRPRGETALPFSAPAGCSPPLPAPVFRAPHPNLIYFPRLESPHPTPNLVAGERSPWRGCLPWVWSPASFLFPRTCRKRTNGSRGCPRVCDRTEGVPRLIGWAGPRVGPLPWLPWESCYLGLCAAPHVRWVWTVPEWHTH
ncbi:histone-lysine N-methyltransferase, H3 lysine-79 specific-like [Antechinus flavipes]|uniref:histone-lysine N-methyltransferase, H3 lysine-79 specific-like n=1 Tax=Antechinus flavipes TaxID=38775 RepID=UPI00223587C1|nr:histone-lysine N-methyltransferase, H3 lysine-79 specific-like [Antechinus flavipes]